MNTSGVALSLFAFGSSTYTCAVLGVFSYAAMAFDRKRCGYVVFAGSFAYLIYFHAFTKLISNANTIISISIA